MFAPGEWILIRSVYRDRVRWAFMHRVVESGDGSLVAYLPPDSPGASMGRDPDGRYLERWVRGDPPVRHSWRSHHVLKLLWPARRHTLELFWDARWTFKRWYVNLQSPLVETRFGFDTTDHALDVVVSPDGVWQWKDEDDFEEAQQLGVFSPGEAADVRAEGERVIARLPELIPTGWESWRADPPGSRPSCLRTGTSSSGSGPVSNRHVRGLTPDMAGRDKSAASQRRRTSHGPKANHMSRTAVASVKLPANQLVAHWPFEP